MLLSECSNLFKGPVLFFFFFQAEDGIRDHCVTGVQTCALPIYLRTPEQVVDVCGVDRDALDLPAGDLARDLAPELPDLTLQLADAGLAGVARDDLAQRGVRDRELLRRQTVLVHLSRNQVALGDLELFTLGVAREGHRLQAVEQRTRNALREVGGRDEQHFRQVEGHAQVVIRERLVLRRVEYLEQRGGRVSLERDTQLVELVEEEYRVLGTRLLHALDDPAWHGADVGAPMASDVGLVAGAAERNANVRPTHGARDRLGDRGLAYPRGADEQQDLTARLLIVFVALRHRVGRALPQLTYGQELEDLILHVLETVVILLEDLRRPLQVERLLRPLVPGQFGHRLEVGADHLGFHRVAARPLQPGELAVDFLARGFGELERLEPLPQVLHLGPFVPFAE